MDLPNINTFTKKRKEMINFKRIAGVLALTLALVQIMPSIPVKATELDGETVELSDGESADGESADGELTDGELSDGELADGESADGELSDDESADDELVDDELAEKCDHEGCNNDLMEDSSLCSLCEEGQHYEYSANNDGYSHRIDMVCDCTYSGSWNAFCWFNEEGVCNECGQSKTTTCYHEHCTNPAGTDMGMCDECWGSEWEWSKLSDIDNETHTFIDVCGKCSSDWKIWTIVESHFNYSDGYCICGYKVSASESTSTSASGNSAPKAPTAEEIAKWAAAKVEEGIKAEVAIPVTDFVSASAVNAIPAEVKGTTTETVFNVSKITTTQGFVAAVDKIVKANPEGKSVSFYSEKPFAFNATSLNALTNANKEFVYMFKHEGHIYKVTIPAGAKVDLEGQRFAGPLYIGAKLGTTALVK